MVFKKKVESTFMSSLFVQNPQTGRAIRRDGRVYRQLVRNGWLDDVPEQKKPVTSPTSDPFNLSEFEFASSSSEEEEKEEKPKKKKKSKNVVYY